MRDDYGRPVTKKGDKKNKYPFDKKSRSNYTYVPSTVIADGL